MNPPCPVPFRGVIGCLMFTGAMNSAIRCPWKSQRSGRDLRSGPTATGYSVLREKARWAEPGRSRCHADKSGASKQAVEGELVPLQDYLTTLRRYSAVILVLAVLGAGVAYLYTLSVEREYRAQADVMVIPARGNNPAELAQGANYIASLAQTYTLLATSPEVLDPVIDDLDLQVSSQRLARSVDVQVPLDTFVLQIRVTDTDSARAAQTANAIAAQLSSTIPQVSPEGQDGLPSVRVTTIAHADEPLHPIKPEKVKIMLLGMVLGVLVGVGVAVYRTKYKSRVNGVEDVAVLTDLGVLGEIPAVGSKRSLVQMVRTLPQGRAAESLRQLAASLRYINLGGQRKVILLTSGSSSEGKSSISLGLSLTLAEAGHSVLYIEADLRRPSAADYTGLETSVGVMDVLVGDATIEEAAQQWGHQNLSVLACGMKPPNPGQVLASEELGALINDARRLFSYIVVDSPPVLDVSDALWLSPSVDGTLVITRVGETASADLNRTLEALERADSPVIGIVLDGVKSRTKGAYYSEDAPRSDGR